MSIVIYRYTTSHSGHENFKILSHLILLLEGEWYKSNILVILSCGIWEATGPQYFTIFNILINSMVPGPALIDLF